MTRRRFLQTLLGGAIFAGLTGASLKKYLRRKSFTFAAIGDYGTDRKGHAEDVSRLVKSWNPDFIITLGDNNYRKTATDNIDHNIGELYGDYIYPYKGKFGPGSPTGTNRFWPSLGNHDWDDGGVQEYFDYFTLPHNERYYDVRIADVHLFCLSVFNEPDGSGPESVQANWIRERVQASDAPWKLVFNHYPPFSSGKYGGTPKLRWPFSTWGVDAVLAGHFHYYERLQHQGIPYFINGLGGNQVYTTFKVHEKSKVRYNDGFGAMQIYGNAQRIVFKFVNTDGQEIDRHEVIKPGIWRTIREM
jgi:hypothetical protein